MSPPWGSGTGTGTLHWVVLTFFSLTTIAASRSFLFICPRRFLHCYFPRNNIRDVLILFLVWTASSARTRGSIWVDNGSLRGQQLHFRHFHVWSTMPWTMLLSIGRAVLLSSAGMDETSCLESCRTWIQLAQLHLLPRDLSRVLLFAARTNVRKHLSLRLHVFRSMSMSWSCGQCHFYCCSTWVSPGFGCRWCSIDPMQQLFASIFLPLFMPCPVYRLCLGRPSRQCGGLYCGRCLLFSGSLFNSANLSRN